MVTPPQPNPHPSPLSHITAALREDNRSLLLQTLLHDPRKPDETPSTIATTTPLDKKSSSYPSHDLQRQQLIFSTPHLRCTLLRNVLKKIDEKKRKRGNKTHVEEEEEMMSDLNEELLGYSSGKCITSTKILTTNGQLLSPYTLTPSDDDDASTTTYILRGGGFDLPSISNAAIHRRKTVGLLNRQRNMSNHLFRFVFVPRMTEVERSFLGELGVVDDFDGGNNSNISYGMVRDSVRGSSGALTSLESLPIDLIPLDEDVLSLELAGGSILKNVGHEGDAGAGKGGLSVPSAACMRHSEVEGCEADVADVVARSLMKLQFLNRESSEDKTLNGAIPRVQGLGPLATAVIDRMMTLRVEEERLESQAEYDEEEEGEDQRQSILQTDATRSIDELVSESGDVEIQASLSSHYGESPSALPSINALLVIDRKIDLVTPLLTPLTYEGLIDDVLEIQVGGCVSVQRSLLEPDDNEVQSKDCTVLSLNDSDPLYKEVRNIHVEIFGSFLQNQAKALKESHSQFTNKETARDLTEIHQFVKQIPVFTRNLRSLTNHIHIAELVKSNAETSKFRQRWQTERSMLESEPCYEVLEDLLASGEPSYRWLCLFCLQSLTSNGIKATRYDALRREVIQTYGYEFMSVLNDLEKAGFLRKRETLFLDSMTTSYSTLRKALNLINAEVDPSDPDDPAYVSSGYCPMTVRWVQASMRGYTGLDEAMRELPAAAGVGIGSGGGGGGRWIDVEQRSTPESLVDAMKRPRAQSLGTVAKSHTKNHDSSTKPVLLLYFVGGVTYMEIAAIRFLSKRQSFPYSLIICTTEIVNGRKLLQSLSC